MTSVKIGNECLDVVESGQGRPIMLLHSLLADRTIFDRVVPSLARERRVILPDLPGFGGSSPAGSAIADIADRIATLFDALGLDGSTDVLGNGFGGFVASTLAIRHGHRFNRLILADTGVAFNEQGKAAFYEMARRVREGGMVSIVDVALKRLFPEAYVEANPEVVAERRASLLKTNPAFFAEACHSLAALDLDREIGTITNPTLVVVGELDAATPPDMSRRLVDSIPGARLVTLAGCGHAPMAQLPDEFLGAIAPFLMMQTAGSK